MRNFKKNLQNFCRENVENVHVHQIILRQLPTTTGGSKDMGVGPPLPGGRVLQHIRDWESRAKTGQR